MRLFSAVIFLSVICIVHKGFSQNLHEIDSIKLVLSTQPVSNDRVDLMSELSEKLIAMQDYEQAQQYLDSIFSQSGKLDYQAGIAKYYNRLGYLLQKQGEFEGASTKFSQSLEKGISLGDSLLVANVCLNLGVNCIKQENYSKAMEYLDRAMKIDSVYKDNSARVLVYNKIALMHRYRGEYPEAISLYEKAIKLAEEIGDKAQAYQTRLNLGIIYKFQENYGKALEIFLETLPYYEQTDNLVMLVPIDNCIGSIFYHQNEYDEALKHLNSALDASRTLGLEMDVATNLSSIGLVYRELGQFNDALKYEFQALRVYSENGSKKEIGLAYMDIGDTYAAFGDQDQAMENYRKSLEIAREIKDDENKSACLIAISKIMTRRAEKTASKESGVLYDTARSYLLESLNIAVEMEQKEYIKNIYGLLYKVDSAAGNLDAALTDYINFTIYKDSLNDIESNKRIAQLQYEFLRQQKEKEITTLTKENELQSMLIRKQKMQRNGILFTTVLLLLTGVLIIRGIQLRRRLEKQQAISKERERISSDLHDDIGSGLSKIILMLEVLHKESRSTEIKEKTRTISEESLELSKNMSSVVWALNSRYDSLESLIAYIRIYASDYFENSPVRFKMIAPAHFPPVHLSSEQRRNLYYAVKEALHNIVKHSKASLAEVRVTYDNQVLSLTVKDNGCGLPGNELNRFGNGIIQMRNRIQGIGGDFLMETLEGTLIMFSLPVGKNRP